jgi:hypothetical protein
LIESAIAVRLDGFVEEGRTGPLRVHVECPDGQGVDVILKSTGPHANEEALVNEMLGSLLAGDLGLPTPTPYFVTLNPDFLGSIGHAAVETRLRAASPLAFGSTDMGSQWRKWNSTDRLDGDAMETALKSIAFDAFVGNPDRSPRNPNLLRCKTDGGIALIDHECAFGFRMKLFPPVRPWQAGNLQPLTQRGADSEHLFFALLVGKTGLPYAVVRDSWADLSEVRLGAYEALLPQEWNSAKAAMTDALAHLRLVRDNIGACVAELARILG